ncbi:MAG: ArsR/SmtB family transcription factor [Promethearchaeota archaeon]
MKAEREVEIKNSLKMCVDFKNDDLDQYFQDLRQKGIDLASSINLQELASTFNVLGNKLRISVLKLLCERDYCVCELEAILDKSQSSISHHLKLLEKAELIRGIKRGYFTHYELKDSKTKHFINLILKQTHQ